MAKLTFLWYDDFGTNQTPLQRNGMAAIPKIDGKGTWQITKVSQSRF